MFRLPMLFLLIAFVGTVNAVWADGKIESKIDWNQWRGPHRDGRIEGPNWPAELTDGSVERLWRIPLGPSYSGPIIGGELVFTTETLDKKTEVVLAFDRKTGKEQWRAQWPGALSVPFFAKSNGDWIRATPAYDGENLYVAGMCDLLVCLDAQTGKERWRVDFVKQFSSPLPAFGFVSSPLVDGDSIYVQAGASTFRLKKATGEVVWRSLKENGEMTSSAFSSPIFAEIAGRRQLVVQGRERLSGVDPATGEVLWSQLVPNYRGMNILTPVIVGDTIFTSTYQNKSWLYKISRSNDKFSVSEVWSNNAQGYMSTPVVIGGFAYIHLQNQRFTCIDLQNGERKWTSPSFGKYCSLVAQGDRILALDQRGVLLLLKANPKAFELLGQVKISTDETWGHLSISGDQIVVRELNALTAFRWKANGK